MVIRTGTFRQVLIRVMHSQKVMVYTTEKGGTGT